METLIFDWEEWDAVDVASTLFYNVTLVKDLSMFDPRLTLGAKLPKAFVDLDKGFLQLMFDNEQHVILSLGFVVIKDDKELVVKP